MSLVLKIAAGVVLAIVVLAVGCSALIASDDTNQASTEDATTTWTWVNFPKCGDTPQCWQIAVTSETGCPNGLYAEVNLFDANGAVVDYTNDSLGALRPKGTAILTFDYYGKGAANPDLTKLNCY